MPEGHVLANEEQPVPEVPSDIFGLLKILTVRRPHASTGEKAWVDAEIVARYRRYEAERKDHEYKVTLMGPMENVVVYCNINHNPHTLFSCHTDTVHSKDGIQQVIWDTVMAVAYKKDNDPLGADDGTGVWLLMQMLEAGVPGTYVFHRGEERGCIGSRWMKEHSAPWLKTYKHAIAFDRRDTTHVITHQRGSECCSPEFARALATELNEVAKRLGYTFDYKPDSTGVYTDTANYAGLIPECTNISIGYEGAHGGGETQDLEHVQALSDVLRAANWAALPATRTPKDPYSYDYSHRSYYGGAYSRYPLAASGPLALDYDDVYGRPLPWAKRFSHSTKGKEYKRYKHAKQSLEDMQAVVLNPPEDLHEFDMLMRPERMAFVRCFPEQADYFIAELLKLRRQVIRLRLAALNPRTSPPPPSTSPPPVVDSTVPGTQEPETDIDPYYGW